MTAPLPRLFAAALLHAADWLLRPRAALAAAPTTPLFELLDDPPEPCIEPLYAVLDGDRRLSLVPTSDGRMAIFAADLEDFVGLRLDRSDVQRMRHQITAWLCDTSAVTR